MSIKNEGLYWNDWNKSAYEGWLEIILHTILCIIIISITIFCIRMIYKNVYHSNPDCIVVDFRFYKYLMLSLIVSIIYIFGTYFLNVLSITVLGWRPKLACFYRQLSLIPYTLQRILAYYFYILRLYTSFNGSIAEISFTRTCVFIISATTSIILATIFYLISMYQMNINNTDFICGNSTMIYIAEAILILIDTSWSIIFSWIYIKKLINITKLCCLRDDQLTYIIKKLTILAVTSVVTTYGIVFMYGITNLFAYQMTSCDIIINNICIILSFKSLDNMYNKLCCCQRKCCNKLNNTDNASLKFGIPLMSATVSSQSIQVNV